MIPNKAQIALFLLPPMRGAGESSDRNVCLLFGPQVPEGCSQPAGSAVGLSEATDHRFPPLSSL